MTRRSSIPGKVGRKIATRRLRFRVTKLRNGRRWLRNRGKKLRNALVKSRLRSLAKTTAALVVVCARIAITRGAPCTWSLQKITRADSLERAEKPWLGLLLAKRVVWKRWTFSASSWRAPRIRLNGRWEQLPFLDFWHVLLFLTLSLIQFERSKLLTSDKSKIEGKWFSLTAIATRDDGRGWKYSAGKFYNRTSVIKYLSRKWEKLNDTLSIQQRICQVLTHDADLRNFRCSQLSFVRDKSL